MTDVLRDEDLQGRLVVSISGEDVAQVRGVLEQDDEVVAITLGKTGLFGGDLEEVLPTTGVRGLGPDAVVVDSPEAFLAPEDLNGARAEVVGSDEPAIEEVTRGEHEVLFTEARGRDVVSDADGEVVGCIDRFVVDPDTSRISSFRLNSVSDMKRYLSWRDVAAFGPVVRVADAGVLRLPDGEREERIRRDYGMLGKRIITDTGHELGKVTDVAFDPEDGTLTCLVLEDRELPGDRLLGVGPYAVVVAA